jgi:ADP-heptose:LPS heptosyltransferase
MYNPQNILLVQLYSNGDCLYATTIARQIKNDFPNCKLSWAIANSCKNIIANNPHVDDVLVTNEVAKNDVVAFRKFKKKMFAEKAAGEWDEIFITHNMDTNLALYDGTIRGMILRTYPFSITVPLQPVLELSYTEISNTKIFAEYNKLNNFKNVILWEYAPQSGQTELSIEMVMAVAKRITSLPDTCVILSSANKFESSKNIIDASTLSVRENAALTHYCTLLIGCSSGITWLTTSSAAKLLPMLQLLNPNAYFMNTPSVDFKRYNIAHNGLIEMSSFTEEKVYECVEYILINGFSAAQKFNEVIPIQFNTTKNIIYNLLVYGEFAAIRKHISIMKSIYGWHPLLIKAISIGFLGAPFKLINNIWTKNVLGRK